MTRGLRAGRILACVAVCLLLICAFYIAAEAGHDCRGDGCPVCTHMRLCLDMLQSLLFAAAAATVFAAVVMKPVRGPGIPGLFGVAAHTPVFTEGTHGQLTGVGRMIQRQQYSKGGKLEKGIDIFTGGAADHGGPRGLCAE